MKTDSYTKAILTVIAIALITLVVQNFNVIPSVTAKASPNFSNSETVNVNVVSINGRSLFGNSLKVEVVNTPEVEMKLPLGSSALDVNVTNYRDFN